MGGDFNLVDHGAERSHGREHGRPPTSLWTATPEEIICTIALDYTVQTVQSAEIPLTTRDKIIAAAMEIVRERGPVQLTIDETAKVAGVSKGGVLYHFPSKDELVHGMIEAMVSKFDVLYPSIYESLPAGPYRSAKAIILTLTHPEGPYSDPVAPAILAAAVLKPELLETVRSRSKECLDRLASDSPDPVLARVACLSVDGQWMMGAVGLETFTEDDRRRLTERALALLDAGEGA
jgi:AcrR family transcriptional regulator